MSYGNTSASKSAADKAAEEQRQLELKQKLAAARGTFNPSPVTSQPQTARYSYAGPKGGLSLNTDAQMAAGRSLGYDMPSISATPQDLDMAARMMIAESRSIKNPMGGVSTPGLQGVAEVMRNRVLSNQYPDTVSKVITQKKQFSPLADGSFAKITPAHPAYQAAYDVARSVFNGTAPPIAGNSLNYGNLQTIMNKPGYSSIASKKAFGGMQPQLVVADAKRPGVFSHAFGTTGTSDVAFNEFGAGPQNVNMAQAPTPHVAPVVAKTVGGIKKAVSVAEAVPKAIIKAPGKIARAVAGPKPITPTLKPEAQIAALASGLNGVQQAMATPPAAPSRTYLMDTSTPQTAAQTPAGTPQMASAAPTPGPSVFSGVGSLLGIAGQKYDEAKAAAMAKAQEAAAGYKQVADAVNALPGPPGQQAAMVKGYATGGKWGAIKAALTYKEPKPTRTASIAKGKPTQVAEATPAPKKTAPIAAAPPKIAAPPMAVTPTVVATRPEFPGAMPAAPAPAQVAEATPPAAPEYTPPGLTPAGRVLQHVPLVKTAFALDKWARSKHPGMKNAKPTSRPSFSIASANLNGAGKSAAAQKQQQDEADQQAYLLAMLLGDGGTYV